MPRVETPSPPSAPPPAGEAREAAVAVASPPSSEDILSVGERLHTNESESDDSEVDEDERSASPFAIPIRRPSILRRSNSPRLVTDHRNTRFDPRVRFYLHLHLNDYTDEELHNSFLKEEDLARIHSDVLESITRMRSSDHQDQPQENEDYMYNDTEGGGGGGGEDEEGAQQQYCPRGLEHVSTPTSMASLRTARIRHIDAVLDEQDRQFLREETDEDRLAQVSVGTRSTTTVQAMMAEDSVARAILLGAADAAFVQQFVRPEVFLAFGEGVGEIAEGDRLSSVLQAAMYISSPSAITATTTSSVTTSSNSDNPDLVRVGSRDRLLDILGHLRSGLEETHSEIEQISQTARRDSHRASSQASSSSSSTSGDDEPNA